MNATARSTHLPKILVWINCGVFLFYGVAYLTAPAFFASFMDIELSAPNALIDTRALYGGMLIGIAAWYGFCALDESRVHMGLFSAFLILLGLCAGRVIGAVIDGSPNKLNIFYICIEACVTLVIFSTLKKTRTA